jgi:hypothetical protein
MLKIGLANLLDHQPSSVKVTKKRIALGGDCGQQIASAWLGKATTAK